MPCINTGHFVVLLFKNGVCIMANILVTGNGFDIYHGLNTKYSEFIDYTRNYESLNPDMKVICESNPFLLYFREVCDSNCKWIDCESEIECVAKCFEKILSQMPYNMRLGIDRNLFNTIEKRVIANFWKYFDFSYPKAYNMDQKYIIEKRKILKTEMILDELKNDLNDVIRALVYYLQKVENETVIDVVSEQVKMIGEINYVVNFNYTSTYRIYGINDDIVFFPHGRLIDRNTVVCGIPDVSELGLEFIYFKKYFQRIQKRTGVLDKSRFDANSVVIDGEEVNTYFFGMSMGKTDEDYIMEIIGLSDTVTIFYHSQIDFERKIINLIDIFGRNFLEEKINNGFIRMVKLKNPIKI